MSQWDPTTYDEMRVAVEHARATTPDVPAGVWMLFEQLARQISTVRHNVARSETVNGGLVHRLYGFGPDDPGDMGRLARSNQRIARLLTAIVVTTLGAIGTGVADMITRAH